MKPLILIATCQQVLGITKGAFTPTTYIDAVRHLGATPLLIPGGEFKEVLSLLDLADGILLTGSPSNVHPSHFEQEVHDSSLPLDPVRDAWTLPLIREALRQGVPLFAICRGFQEFNVALGGSLHQAIHELPGFMDHRPADQETMEAKYRLAHSVALSPHGLLAKWIGTNDVMVNSVHGQGIRQLASGLSVEATAPDGIIEAVTHPGAPGFNLAVQWHPEWNAESNAASRCILGKFADACRLRQRGRACSIQS